MRSAGSWPPPCEGGRGLIPCAVVALVGGLLAGAPVGGQISPGKLSRAHSELDGSGSCLRCHQARQRVAAELCLGCHQLLAERIDAGQGLHAQDGYSECQTCHIEHHGPDFELVWWGKEGTDAFDHSLTGFELDGRHDQIGCRDCHSSEHIRVGSVLREAGKDLNRTYLGLEPVCLSCHQDQHRGQAPADGCRTCHDMAAWDPPSRFDHDRTEFPLTGRHRTAACTGCHATLDAEPSPESDASAEIGGGLTYLEFDVARFGRCTECHSDAHEGRLGSDCASCHTTLGWSIHGGSAFDHDQTAFALEGAHRTVACESCHPPGAGLRIDRFASCTDCHDDSHLGQFEATVDGCLSCHTVTGFLPAAFSLDAHRESGYALEGAHLATPCDGCHVEVPVKDLWADFEPAEAAGSFPDPLPETVRRFRYASAECEACHEDPHEGDVDRWVELEGCESCHQLETWRLVTFDHDRTDFELAGRHAVTGCVDCHADTANERELAAVALANSSAACVSCHEDPHGGQFLDEAGLDRCETCHGFEDWPAALFDHNRDSGFALAGAHLDVACARCHPVEGAGESAFLRYKPVEGACESCHAAGSERSTG